MANVADAASRSVQVVTLKNLDDVKGAATVVDTIQPQILYGIKLAQQKIRRRPWLGRRANEIVPRHALEPGPNPALHERFGSQFLDVNRVLSRARLFIARPKIKLIDG